MHVANRALTLALGVPTLVVSMSVSPALASAHAWPAAASTASTACGPDGLRYSAMHVLPDPGQGEALGVNDLGEVAGDVLIPDHQPQAAVWVHGRFSLIPTGLVKSAALSVNDSGLVVGQGLDSSGRRRGWAWSGGAVTFLKAPHLDSISVQVRHVDRSGAIVGTATDASGTPFAVVWPSFRDVPKVRRPLAGLAGSLGVGVDDAGTVTGSSTEASGAAKTATVWAPAGRPHALPAVGGPAEAWAVNDSGLVVGSGLTGPPGAPGVESDFLAWRDGALTDLGVLPGDDDAGPNALNDRGVAVGFSASDLTPTDSGAVRAVYWPGTGRLRELPVPPDTVFGTGHDLNDRNVVVGLVAGADNLIHAVWWRPRCGLS